ncbi:MAG: S8/S53 family peptidase [Defluviitaleaceae bacterium]|nr:S8/S53 family peptidase [Defluviitaleaceae bacterium]
MKKLVALLLLVSLLTSCGQTAQTGSGNQAAQAAATSTEATAPASTAAEAETTAPATEAVTQTETAAETETTAPTADETVAPTDTEAPSETPFAKLQRFADVRAFSDGDKATYAPDEYNPNDIYTYTFNEGTVFEGSEDLAKQILENGKNPGLGVRGLHDEGITGKGVNVAIIDQNLLLDHPEFADKIAEYYDTGCDQPADQGSMHAPAVTSLLVGDSVGVAPGAKVYFAAVPMWKEDSKYIADALNWIMDQNSKLPDNEKIRVVSISTDPSGQGSTFTNQDLYDQAVLLAQQQGILVLDCRVNSTTGIIQGASYAPSNPDDITKTKPITNYPTNPAKPGKKEVTNAVFPSYFVYVPTEYRTVAEEYSLGSPSYAYWGQGGLSWAIPYAAGVLALGWQVNPDLDKDAIVKILQDTCYVTANGAKIINPPAFIEAVKETINK